MISLLKNASRNRANRSSGIRALALLSSFLLASCAMGPDYSRPRVEVSEKFRMAETEGRSIANLPWWELIQDEQLQFLIRQALAGNKDLKQAVASVEELQARLGIARWDFLPKMDMNVNAPAFGRLGGFLFPGFPTPYSYFGQATLNWEIDVWGRVRRSNEAALADLMAREENRRAVVLTLVSNVAQSYFDLRQFDARRGLRFGVILPGIAVELEGKGTPALKSSGYSMTKRKSKGAYMISSVAEMYGIHPQTLRLYEREGLLKPSRTEGNTRLYTDEDLQRLEFILSLARDLGVNIAGMAIILQMRERMEEMQRQIQEFVQYIQQEVLTRASAAADPSKGAIVPVRRQIVPAEQGTKRR